MTTVMQEAEQIVYGDREETYGHPAKNFEAAAEYWTAHLSARYGAEGFEVLPVLDAKDVAVMMILLKIARHNNAYKRDNIVDIIGYAGCMQKIHDYEGANG